MLAVQREHMPRVESEHLSKETRGERGVGAAGAGMNTGKKKRNTMGIKLQKGACFSIPALQALWGCVDTRGLTFPFCSNP